MKDLFPFMCFMAYLIIIRLIELMMAKKNENWMKQRGAVEFGTSHYPYMIMMHVLFFVSMILEKVFLNRELSPVWASILIIFITTQFMRGWVILSLGRYWNTKIIVIPNEKVIMKGPYRFIKHPNYAVVSLEFVLVPLLFNDYITACIFTVLNIFMLRVRIKAEEKALQSLTEYEGNFHGSNRFIPKFIK
ncbi:isoprenylcysteine carboxyl methyltransferase family protein [Neobacillus mesonae]|uniref:isoprenylcysteine carboxyl methyltransferase family protein n=1 Tax=Neobacillus mesonae TaxID=1193713 RepID=UPI00203CF7B1|nr:isoprenylcysteine carboxylmethyltransferase family protein [Neobacillus mesonae]MCM3566852.1 hypothetical protein [Neobacillus mesonae]